MAVGLLASAGCGGFRLRHLSEPFPPRLGNSVRRLILFCEHRRRSAYNRFSRCAFQWSTIPTGVGTSCSVLPRTNTKNLTRNPALIELAPSILSADFARLADDA